MSPGNSKMLNKKWPLRKEEEEGERGEGEREKEEKEEEEEREEEEGEQKKLSKRQLLVREESKVGRQSLRVRPSAHGGLTPSMS